MITERMTKQEIKAEVISDYPNVSNYAKKLICKFRRIVIKTPKFPVCVHKPYTSKRRNKWIIILKAFSKKDSGDLTRGLYFSYYNSSHGYYAIVFHPQCTTIYSPHFFSRYAERKNIDLHGIELMIHYFRNNTNLVSVIEKTENTDGSIQKIIEGSTEEGILLGLMLPEQIILARTFITREMAKGGQIEDFTNYENWRQEIFYKGYM